MRGTRDTEDASRESPGTWLGKSGRATFARILRREDSWATKLSAAAAEIGWWGAFRRHRRAQKARKRPAAIRLAAGARRWHRTKLDGAADRREHGAGGCGDEESERERQRKERMHGRATVLGRARNKDAGCAWNIEAGH